MLKAYGGDGRPISTVIAAEITFLGVFVERRLFLSGGHIVLLLGIAIEPCHDVIYTCGRRLSLILWLLRW